MIISSLLLCPTVTKVAHLCQAFTPRAPRVGTVFLALRQSHNYSRLSQELPNRDSITLIALLMTGVLI
jgi:hypothetical protein